jgi:sigma-B regulation protein RsbU (phosphoserine phosphatase)
VTPTDVPQILRADALGLALGALMIVVGLAALFSARALRRPESPLPWFGTFTLLYGLRLLARTTTFPLLFDLGGGFWRYLIAAITYSIPVPVLLFLRSACPPWKRALGLAALILSALAASGIAADAVLRRPNSARVPYNLVAVALMVACLGLLLQPRSAPPQDLPTLRVGIIAFAATAILDNLRSLGFVSWSGLPVESLGATTLAACLGTVAARRVLQNSRRLAALDRELSIARQIQSSILPARMPRVPGLTVAARYKPMTAVAGDFYDFVEVGEHGLGVLVADVAGHGVPAALLASMVKIAMAAQSSNADRPERLLKGMHETLSGRLGGQYVTAAYLYLDRDSGVMRYAGAGHPPLLRWRPSEGGPTQFEKNGFPLGLMDEGHYQELEAPLQSGDRFILYTDGLVDGVNPSGELLGLERVSLLVTAGSGLGTERLADHILENHQRWTDRRLDDDLTLVIVDCV